MKTPQESPAIALRQITKAFGAVAAVKGVDLSINPGETVALLGPNGAGKTTTLDIALGLIHPDQGEVELFGALLTFMWINSPFHRVTSSQSVHKLASPGPG